ncbi:hypothetical protein BC351_11495 [Paenibacillus ferrarius]|uniref:Uncharacterized protein n=1 Tax=Paenibacillus ferrarius TaxID=1469647 RepID=A0A1V4H7Z4_9BACL|nr:hypothetical protein BC351_11495 [Paenibacillus ferrarius]
MFPQHSFSTTIEGEGLGGLGGSTGSTGFTGSTGIMGLIGTTGTIGIIGVIGVTGGGTGVTGKVHIGIKHRLGNGFFLCLHFGGHGNIGKHFLFRLRCFRRFFFFLHVILHLLL